LAAKWTVDPSVLHCLGVAYWWELSTNVLALLRLAVTAVQKHIWSATFVSVEISDLNIGTVTFGSPDGSSFCFVPCAG